MYNTKERVFIKFLIPLAVGIFSAYLSGINFSIWLIAAGVPLLLIIHLLIRRRYIDAYKQGWIFGIAMSVAFFFTGFLLFSNAYDLHSKTHFIHYSSDDWMRVRLSEPPVFKDKFVRCIAKFSGAGTKDSFHAATGNAVIYFQNTDESLNFFYGDEVLIRNKPSPLDTVSNPYQYDYRGYLDKKNIHYTFFLRQNEFVPLHHNAGYAPYYLACEMRNWCVASIKKYVGAEKEAAVISALVVGYRDEVSADVVQSFSSAGVVHILAVSGMHVGILYWLLEKILRPLNKNSAGRILKVILLLLFIWFFAMITGLSGSVVRASAMLTLLIIGKNINRHTDIINLLCGSAFCILVIDPFSFLDAGFQLSFCALVGIALFERNFYRMAEFKNPVLNLGWQMCSVSMAAQLGVLPLTLFYFNQFPLMFLLANVVGVPLSTIVLYGGVLLFIISPFEWISTVLGKILWALTYLLDEFIHWVQSLPFASMNIAQFDVICFVLAFVGIYFLAQYFEYRRIKNLVSALVVTFVIACIYSYNSISALSKREIMFMHFGKGNLYVFRERNNAMMLGDSSLLADDYFLQYTNSYLKKTCVNHLRILPIEKLNDTTAISWNHFHSTGNFISFDGMSGAIFRRNKISSDEKLNLDFLIAENSYLSPAEIKKSFSPELLVADENTKNLPLKKIKSECASLSLRFHFLPTDGAYIKQF